MAKGVGEPLGADCAPNFAANPAPTPPRIALFGVGKMGQNHLRALLALQKENRARVAFIFDSNESLARSVAAEFGLNLVRDFEGNLGALEGAIIATPTFSHFNYIKTLGRRVKNILVEKPLTHDLATSRKVETLAKQRGLNIQVGFIERYNPAFLALRQLLVGKNILNIDLERTSKASSRIVDVDVVADLMIHDIDLALLLCGEVREIHAQGVVVGGIVEFAKAILRHKNGRLSSITASRITHKKTRQIRVMCEDSHIECDLLAKNILVTKQRINARGEITEKLESFAPETADSLRLELLDFVNLCANCREDSPQDSLRQGANHAPNHIDGLNAMKIAHEVQRQILKKDHPSLPL